MKAAFLEFEQSAAEPEVKTEEPRFVQDDSAVDVPEETSRLASKSQQPAKDLYVNLTPWQVAQTARHPQRPYTLDYVREIFTDFHELHGDRAFADDLSTVGGLTRFNGQACMVIDYQKGQDAKERVLRNSDMSKPEGCRKAKRLMELTDRPGLPIFTFVDTPDALSGIDVEERGQSEAIGHNPSVMAGLKVLLTVTIIGGDGSGGTLAIAMGDSVIMLQSAIYAVISPEGCVSILWKVAERAPEIAKALGLTAHCLRAFGLIDKVVNESLDDAHRDPKGMVTTLKRASAESLCQFQGMKTSELQACRHKHLMAYGKFKETEGR